MQERDYQISDKLRIMEALSISKRVIYQLPTGGGKTVVASKIIENYKDKNILILVHKRKLISQMKNSLAILNVEVGVMQGQNLINLESNVIIASVQTAVKDYRIEFLLERSWDLVVVDEARRTRTASYDKVLDKLKDNNSDLLLLGLDATPSRRDKRPLDYHFNEMIVSSENTYSLIEKGYLSNTVTYATPIGDIGEYVNSWGGDFQISQLSSYMRQPVYLTHILQSWFKYAVDKQTIIFAVDKEHAQEIYDLFVDNGIEKIGMIHSDFSDEQVDNMFELYETGEIQVIINIEMITEGVDLPNTQCLLIARPTQSLTLYLQILGRGLRKKKDNSKLIVIDCAGVTEKFGGVRTTHRWSLDSNIKPNGVNKMKIFGKNEAGDYIEDIIEWIGELVELSPEEYALQIASGKETIIEINKEIDTNINECVLRIQEYIRTLFVGNSMLDDVLVYTDLTDRFMRYGRITFMLVMKSSIPSTIRKENFNFDSLHRKGCGFIKIAVEELKFIGASSDSYYVNGIHSNEDILRARQAITASYVIGQFNYQILTNPSITNFIYSIVDEIRLLYSDKIDITNIEKIERENIEQQYLQQMRDHCSSGVSFQFNKKIHGGYYFKGFFGLIDSIRIEGNVKKHNNMIYINNRTDEDYIKSFIKEEKIIEMLKAGHWNIN